MLSFILLAWVLPFVVLTVLVEAEWFGWATVSMLASLGIYGWIHRLDALPWVKEHGVYLLEGTAVYLAAGVAWSFAKWFLFLMRFRSEFRDAKAEYVLGLGLPKGSDVPDDKLKEFRDGLSYRNVSGYPLKTKPLASKSKSKIVAWMAFWPCSMVGYVLNDPVRRLFNALFALLKGSYQKMADRLLNDPELK